MHKTTVMRVYLVAVMMVLSFVSYQAFTTPMPTRVPDEQANLYKNVPAAILGPPPTARAVGKGKALSYIQIPRFGDNWLWTTLEGVDMDTLAKGPGHFPNTELPGEEGNSVFAAHRATHGDPFLDFDKLEIGDEVIISQSGARWIYELTTAPKIISEDAQWVLEDFSEGKWMTLTTCWPKYGSEKRMYVRAQLTDIATP